MRGTHRRATGQQAGMTLIELLIAMLVLAVGLVGILALITGAIASNSTNKNDSTATMVAQSVMEVIVSRSANLPGTGIGAVSGGNPNPYPSMTDCQGNTFYINTDGQGGTLPPALPPGATTGAGAPIYVGASGDLNNGNIDWSIKGPGSGASAITTANSTTAGYAMLFTTCGTGGLQTVYEVRWNVLQVSSVTKYVTVSARKTRTTNSVTGTSNLVYFAKPVTLRSAAGS